MKWLTRPLTSGKAIVLSALDPARLRDFDLKSICLRMHAIMDTIEMPRCEGRLLPIDIFDRTDTLESQVFHGPRPRLSDWSGLIVEFGEYYGLGGTGPIPVDPVLFDTLWARYADIIGSPNRPTAMPGWLSAAVVALARGIDAEQGFDRMPILADALQDAGCDEAVILDHCRSPDQHALGEFVRGGRSGVHLGLGRRAGFGAAHALRGIRSSSARGGKRSGNPRAPTSRARRAARPLTPGRVRSESQDRNLSAGPDV